ncbi:VanZ family protein [Thomasclavelia cocleata]|uniref:VanZ like family protein n=1 Tax=Thomasclavelia cocleata TaxID=69824 RepID=A0A1I0FY15_9FIRM|nr:VanZ family protein [Thomasclavelia cocleata]MCR1961504.1 VanZ family protein [Thomasclavelia cocleata]NDO42333.1 VanZ family protein [Thomasclavelia cocleata]PJN80264.1 VanZ family protein [Thomasclavelia cocleata]SET63273.1 VanZ like family protein [Thomasclavelia cocleata]
MVLKKLHLSNIILTICSLVYFWILIKIILLKNGFINYGYNANFILFDFVNQYHNQGLSQTLLINILGNLALFIPLSIILINYFKSLTCSNIIFANFITSLSFELIQLSTGWGIFDVDDIFLNTLGGIIGIIIYHLITKNKHSKIPSTIFLINFGIIGYISLYKFYPILLPSFII